MVGLWLLMLCIPIKSVDAIARGGLSLEICILSFIIVGCTLSYVATRFRGKSTKQLLYYAKESIIHHNIKILALLLYYNNNNINTKSIIILTFLL